MFVPHICVPFETTRKMIPPGVSKSLKKVQMSGKTFGQKSKCLGLNRDFQANPGGVLSGEGVFCQCQSAAA